MARRIGFLLTAAVVAIAINVGTAVAAPKPPDSGGNPGGGNFQSFCNEQGGTFNDQGTPGASDDTCATTKTETKTEPFENRSREAGKSGKGFDQQGTQDVTTTTTTTLDKKNDQEPETTTDVTRSEPVITGCTNPGGKEVSTTNPNCQANTPGKL